MMSYPAFAGNILAAGAVLFAVAYYLGGGM
jgi:hypothetical protein